MMKAAATRTKPPRNGLAGLHAALLTDAIAAHEAGDHTKARDLYQRILTGDPKHTIASHHLGLIEYAQGRNERAIDLLKKAVASAPDWPEAHSNLAAVFRAVKNHDAAMASVRRAIAINPDCAAAQANLGSICEDGGDLVAALAAHLRACELNPNLLEAHINAVQTLQKLGRGEEALAICEAIAKRHPNAPQPHFHAGNILFELLRPREAIEAYRHALRLQPGFAYAHCNLGNTLQRMGAFDAAIAAYQEAIALDPSVAEFHCNLGAAYEYSGQKLLSIPAYRRALECDPAFVGVIIQLYHQERNACDWTHTEAREAAVAAAIPTYPRPLISFPLLNGDFSPELQLQGTRLWARAHSTKPAFQHRRPPAATGGSRLKIGYLSADFCNHATAHLMADLLESHDRQQFEIIAYSHGTNDHSTMRQRLERACDRFIELGHLDDREAAQQIFDDGIDIIVDLKGYTQFARTNIIARRPAPVQVNFLGYPGTMGADFIDYVIADPVVLPMADQIYYDEKIVHLPESYQPNDRQRTIAGRIPTRRECGLPDTGFVFCCFNNNYKISPTIFAVWMRILNQTEGSVLWLFDAYPGASGNLRQEAQSRGIDPDRLVFAPRLSVEDHLARQKLADLFLDTLPYNAHTTASEALWVGLPVLTIRGTAFAGRVAASLLEAIGLPELITESLAEYEAQALDLARRPDRLAAFKRRLHANRETHPLFDTPRFAHHIESAYRRMWAIWASGGTPEAFAVAPLPPRNPTPGRIESKSKRQRFQACPLCASRDFVFFVSADCSAHPAYEPDFDPKLDWLNCKSCGHIFTSTFFETAPMAPQTALGHMIEEGRHRAGKIVARLARLHADNIEASTWLDVDVGDGVLLFTAAEWGFQAHGLDRDENKVALLQQLGFTAQHGRLMDWAPPRTYDIVSCVDSLQHAVDPRLFLNAAKRLLKPEGLLYLSLPNKDALAFAFLHAKGENPYWSELTDYHLFGRGSLYSLLRDEGFEPIDYQVSETHRIGMEVIARKMA